MLTAVSLLIYRSGRHGCVDQKGIALCFRLLLMYSWARYASALLLAVDVARCCLYSSALADTAVSTIPASLHVFDCSWHTAIPRRCHKSAPELFLAADRGWYAALVDTAASSRTAPFHTFDDFRNTAAPYMLLPCRLRLMVRAVDIPGTVLRQMLFPFADRGWCTI